jgi:hypothetical protein
MFRTSMLSASLALAATGLLGGCGAGASLFGSPEIVANQPALADGYVTASGGVYTNSSNAIAVGDNSVEGRRGFVRFSLGGIPGGAEVVSAVLYLAQADVSGTPYATLGTMRVDHMDLGAGIDAGDYFAAALVSDIGVLSANPLLETKALDVTLRVAADLTAGRTTSDYRLRFPLQDDGDAVVDTAHMEDMENHKGSGQLPLLVVTYKD